MNRINTKDGGVYPMVYTILYQFGDGLYHPILVICWMIHSWVYYTRHFSTVFSVPMCTSLLRTLNFDWCWLNDLEPSLFFLCVCVRMSMFVDWAPFWLLKHLKLPSSNVCCSKSQFFLIQNLVGGMPTPLKNIWLRQLLFHIVPN